MTREVRYCALPSCGKPIGAEKRSDAKYCSSGCRTLASDIRRGVRVEEPQTRQFGEPLAMATCVPWAIIALAVGATLGSVTL